MSRESIGQLSQDSVPTVTAPRQPLRPLTDVENNLLLSILSFTGFIFLDGR
jgi:hypothetical protein